MFLNKEHKVTNYLICKIKLTAKVIDQKDKATKYDQKNCHKLLDILHSDKYQKNKDNKNFIRVTHFTQNPQKVLDNNYTNI